MKALITGITGQDGSYLAELLLSKGYEVFGLIRRSSEPNTKRIQHILDKVTLIPGDLSDSVSINNAVRGSDPDEVYNLAGMSFVGASYKMPEYTLETVLNGAVTVFEAVKRYRPRAKVYQASSSEMFGRTESLIQDEWTPFRPVSPYGVAKVGSHYAAKYYRDVYGMNISCGILFNHESPRRGSEFVTQKICRGLKEVKAGKRGYVGLGNLEAHRDWGHARDYVEAMWMMNASFPGDYVIGTGLTWSIRDFAQMACDALNLDFGKVVKVEEMEKRDAEVPHLQADPRKAERILGWKAKTPLSKLIEEMLA